MINFIKNISRSVFLFLPHLSLSTHLSQHLFISSVLSVLPLNHVCISSSSKGGERDGEIEEKREQKRQMERERWPLVLR